jgi:hypothetical protein
MTIVTIRSWVKLAKNAMARRDFSVSDIRSNAGYEP